MSTHNLERLSEEVLRGLFDSIDVDRSGSLQRGELIKAIRKRTDLDQLLQLPSGGGRLADIEDLFSKFDKDKSNSIDFEEFSGLIHQARVDAHRRAALSQPKGKGGKGASTSNPAPPKQEEKKKKKDEKPKAAAPAEKTPEPKTFVLEGESVQTEEQEQGQMAAPKQSGFELTVETEEVFQAPPQVTNAAPSIIEGDLAPVYRSRSSNTLIPLRQRHAIVINKNRNDLWKLISNFQTSGALFFEPNEVRSVSLQQGTASEVGAIRKIELHSGAWGLEKLTALNATNFSLSFVVEKSSLNVWHFHSHWELIEITLPQRATLFEAVAELEASPEEWGEVDSIFRVLLNDNLQRFKKNVEAA